MSSLVLDPADVTRFTERFNTVVDNVEQVIRGKADVIELGLICLLAEGHLLLEDVPGVGKTTLAKAIARSCEARWHRIQFTPDLLPSDVTGVTIFNRAANVFEFRPGGIFANIVLGDEINRASPKTQAALLEAMEERQVTVDAHSYPLAAPFMVIATQNPVEHEGTYPLPESQLDRFLMRVSMGYPTREAELGILEHQFDVSVDDLSPVLSTDDIAEMVAATHAIHVAPSLRGYIVDVLEATRRHPSIVLGVSPRGGLGLLRAARARAAAIGRPYVVPDDIKALAGPVIEHRLVLAGDAALSGATQSDVLADILASVPVPTRAS
jgi:MoxR-like ATPase